MLSILRMRAIADAVAKKYCLRYADLLSPNKTAKIKTIRNIAMCALRYAGASLSQISIVMNRHYTTVIHSLGDVITDNEKLESMRILAEMNVRVYTDKQMNFTYKWNEEKYKPNPQKVMEVIPTFSKNTKKKTKKVWDYKQNKAVWIEE